jgi:hypothetical protein
MRMSLGRYWWHFNRERRRGLLGAWHYHRTLNRVLDLRLPKPEADYGAAVHVVTGKEYWKLGLWMLASFFYTTNRSWPVIIHDDGSCTPSDLASISAVVPFATIVPRADADRRLHQQLEAFPKTRDLRSTFPLLLKLTDTTLLKSSPQCLVLDCDLLFFREPAEILTWSAAPEHNLFLTDISDASAVPPAQINSLLGVNMLENLNSGLCALRPDFLDLELMERALTKTALIDAPRRWTVEQTLFAILAGQRSSKLLPSRYLVSSEKRAPKSTVMRHYIGKVRDSFYAEGLAAVASDVRSAFRA